MQFEQIKPISSRGVGGYTIYFVTGSLGIISSLCTIGRHALRHGRLKRAFSVQVLIHVLPEFA
jgi:hypothetical protein